jgi:hypothetical protein
MEDWKDMDKSLLRIKVEIKTDKEALLNSGVENKLPSYHDVRERQLFQIHKFNLNVWRLFKIENQ